MLLARTSVPEQGQTGSAYIMNHEPVAWMRQDFDGEWVEVMPGKGTPFYTHPVKALTDEEIIEIWKEFDDKDADDWFIAIARAILKKAQEK